MRPHFVQRISGSGVSEPAQWGQWKMSMRTRICPRGDVAADTMPLLAQCRPSEAGPVNVNVPVPGTTESGPPGTEPSGSLGALEVAARAGIDLDPLALV